MAASIIASIRTGQVTANQTAWGRSARARGRPPRGAAGAARPLQAWWTSSATLGWPQQQPPPPALQQPLVQSREHAHHSLRAGAVGAIGLDAETHVAAAARGRGRARAGRYPARAGRGPRRAKLGRRRPDMRSGPTPRRSPRSAIDEARQAESVTPSVSFGAPPEQRRPARRPEAIRAATSPQTPPAAPSSRHSRKRSTPSLSDRAACPGTTVRRPAAPRAARSGCRRDRWRDCPARHRDPGGGRAAISAAGSRARPACRGR